MFRLIVSTTIKQQKNSINNKSAYYYPTLYNNYNNCRCFFWSSDNNNNRNNNKDDDIKNSITKNKSNVDSKSKENETKESTTAATAKVEEQNDNDSNTISSSNSSPNKSNKQPYRMGIMEDAPRYPHLLALPVTNRPLFPGIIYSFTLSDPKVIKAMEENNPQSDTKNHGFIGTFLRKDSIVNDEFTTSLSSSSNNSPIIEIPEVITDRMFQDNDDIPIGVIMGLAWTSMGGSALYIETKGLKKEGTGGGSLKVTGQLGSVMNESTQIAYTIAKSRVAHMFPDNTYFSNHDIHMHVPEGATPKDGPSAGITMITAMLSLSLQKPIRNDLAMTGEVSLTEKVLPVGGIKEKTMAARRAGIKCIIFPDGNRRDFEELPDYLKDGLEVHFAKDYDDVFNIAFGTDTEATLS